MPAFVALTKKEDLETTYRGSFAEWAAGLSLEQYLEREDVIAARDFSVRRTTWALVESSEILASCETYERPCLYKQEENAVVVGKAYSVASVFVPEQHRCKGYASSMMAHLRDHLQSLSGVVVSNLYSDIGPDFYGRLGWKVFPHVELTLPARIGPEPHVRWLMLKDLKDTAARDFEAMTMKLLNNAAAGTIALPPSFSNYEWHVARTLFYAKAFAIPAPTNFGALHKSGDFIVWAHDFGTAKQLNVLRLQATSAAGASELLKAASVEAHGSGLTKVVIWNPSATVSEAASHIQDSKEQEMAKSLPSLWAKDDMEVANWCCSERFCWV
ncbi:hypothetical protein HDU85_004496 [Gaertneriomyces sp. JEL0708]|nr:hypothetical protein HDU85_004496 [Gaertneriomyces sp. JEL0708]